MQGDDLSIAVGEEAAGSPQRQQRPVGVGRLGETRRQGSVVADGAVLAEHTGIATGSPEGRQPGGRGARAGVATIAADAEQRAAIAAVAAGGACTAHSPVPAVAEEADRVAAGAAGDPGLVAVPAVAAVTEPQPAVAAVGV